jgi:hypothetical protein
VAEFQPVKGRNPIETVPVTTDNETVEGNGSPSSPLQVVPGALTVHVDGITIGGSGASSSPLAVIPAGLANEIAVLTDGITTTGNGTVGNPIVAVGASETTIYLNVKAYGAVGNGTTDDTLDIRAAINAAEAVGGGTVYFPDSTGNGYAIAVHAASGIQADACLQVPTGVSLLGQSQETAGLFLLADQPDSARPIYVYEAAYVEISHLFVNGNKANQTDTNEHRDAILLNGAGTSFAYVHDCTLYNNTGSGIVVLEEVVDTLISHCYIHNNDWNGISAGDAGGQYRLQIEHNYVTGNNGGFISEFSSPGFAGGDWSIVHNYFDSPAGNDTIAIVGQFASGDPANTFYITHVVIRDNDVQGGGIYLGTCNDVVIDGNIVNNTDESAEDAAFPFEVSGNVQDVWCERNSFTLNAGATAPQCIYIACNESGDATTNINFMRNVVYVDSTVAHGVRLQCSGIGRVCGNTIIGNSGIATALYGVFLDLSIARNMDIAIIDDNYIADFKAGIATDAVAGTVLCNECCIRRNEFEVISAGVLTNCVLWQVTSARHSIQQAQAWGNSCVGNAATMFGSFPTCPILIGGNRGSGGIYSCAGSPNGQITDAQGSVAYQRDAGSDGLVGWINFGGTDTGWHSINVT